MLEKILAFGRRVIPKQLFKAAQPAYHYLLAFTAALIYRFPARQIFVVMVTGTKGKSTTAELINAIFEEAGFTTALAGTIRIKIANHSKANPYKMTIPGRFFVQSFLRQAVKAGCTHAILEMTSEGAKQFRHKYIDYDAFVFTNLAPEHIESHGSYENYAAAKVEIARQLERSQKPNKIMVINADDQEAARFLALKIPNKTTYSLREAPGYVHAGKLIGDFNKSNILAAGTLAEALGIPQETILHAVQKFEGAPGRMEPVPGAPFTIIVDYAHTPDSLKAVYESFKDRRKICVLGGTGGGRDKWKRPLMGQIAGEYCDQIFLTDEDPYDEDPEQIVKEVAAGVADKTKYQIIMDRRLAIRKALKAAQPGDAVLVTGKGTDPYIMRAKGAKEPWSDFKVVQEELTKINA